jgi:AcrR family transcriptional regulator
MGRRKLPIVGQAEPPRKDASENRERILAAARRLLAERPIGEICMDAVAAEAGVGKGTLYRRFADRASLCHALLHEDAILLQNDVLDGLGLALDAPWLERIRRFLQALFAFVYDHASLLSEAAAFEGGASLDHPGRAWQRDVLSLYLTRAAEAGEIPPLDATITAELILSGLDPDLLDWQRRRGFEKEVLAAAFHRFWRQGISS